MRSARRAARALRRAWRALNPPNPAPLPTPLTFTQEMFFEWNAARLGISTGESRERYVRSWLAFPNGHRGAEFYSFNQLAHKALQVFFSDSPTEAFDAYRHHAPMHFLMMLGYREPTWTEHDKVVLALEGRTDVTILDFGCGLAEQSRTLAGYLMRDGRRVHLALADIATLRRDFLVWLGGRTGMPTIFLECSLNDPIPALPPCDVCFATEFFEHVPNPLDYFERFNDALGPGGVLMTNLADHSREFMHLSSDLSLLRDRVRGLGYEELVPFEVYRKPQ